MPPKFSLQSVLDYRHSLVESLEIQLAKLLKEAQDYVDLQEKLAQLRVSLFAELSESQMGELDLFVIQHLHGNIQLVDAKMEQVRAALVEVNARVDVKRAEMIIARQEEETLAILKNKEIERFKLDQDQIEGRQMDDVYISQAFRHRQSGEAFL